MEIAEVVVAESEVDCDEREEGVRLVRGEEVETEMGEGVTTLEAVTVECVVTVAVSEATVSVAAGDPPLAMRGCELVRCVEVGGA